VACGMHSVVVGRATEPGGSQPAPRHLIARYCRPNQVESSRSCCGGQRQRGGTARARDSKLPIWGVCAVGITC
jgi:hypothetical protein